VAADAVNLTRITSYRDGPLIVRGPFRLEDQDGDVIDSGRDVIALCRCGKSRHKPFCDGTHKTTRFRAPSTPTAASRPPRLITPRPPA
jgi:CDGSH-type Zn-finger protein